MSYHWKYYLTHPWVLPGDLWRVLKWAWQRVFRGWDDRVVWSIDWYLSENMPIWLRVLKEDKVGVPVDFVTLDDDGKEVIDEEGWDAVLDEMIAGFEAARRVQNTDYPIYVEAHQIMEECGYNEKGFIEQLNLFNEVVDELGEDRLAREANEAMALWKRGAELFVEHFFSLWD